MLSAKTYAALQGRDYVTPDDIKTVVPPVFRHRIILKPESEIEGLDADAVVEKITKILLMLPNFKNNGSKRDT